MFILKKLHSLKGCKRSVHVQNREMFTLEKYISSKSRSVDPRPYLQREIFTNSSFTVYFVSSHLLVFLLFTIKTKTKRVFKKDLVNISYIMKLPCSCTI
jgi:hypothetical protein